MNFAPPSAAPEPETKKDTKTQTMAEQDIIQNVISRLGQSQADRLPPELDRHFVDVDERRPETLLFQAKKLAELIQFYPLKATEAVGNWSPFFPAKDKEGHDLDEQEALVHFNKLLEQDDGEVPPHLGLYAAFLRLYRFPQQAINALTGKHLDFQFQRVLRFEPRPAQPDHAHLLLELKKGATPVAITPQQMFSASKDNRGVELIYKPVREVVINHGQIADLKSIFRDVERLRFAPTANSADGLGGALDKDKPRWSAFGHANLPEAQIGFALASPVLRMAEGNRTIRVKLELNGLDPQRHTHQSLAAAFTAHLSGPKGWIEAESLTAQLTSNQLTLTAIVSNAQPAIIDYDAKIHGHVLAAQSPALQLLVKQVGSLGYQDLAGLTLNTVRIQVDVDSLAALNVENDFGKLNAKKAFQPFGPQPVVGSRLMIGCDEALSKRLKELTISLTWQGAPPNLTTWYQNYTNKGQLANGVSGHLVYQDRSGQSKSAEVVVIANASTAKSTLEIAGPPPAALPQENKTDSQLFALSLADTFSVREAGLRLARRRPLFMRSNIPPPTVRSGFITIALNEDFLHTDYRREIIENARLRRADQKTFNEPYTPIVQTIQLSYSAESDLVDVNDYQTATDLVDVSQRNLESFSRPDVQFFHVGCFGQMREHAYLRHRFAFVVDKRVSLVPFYPDEGEFMIGVRGVTAGDSLSLLVQAAEGSADPDLIPQPLTWSVLCENYWRSLTNSELVLDTTRGLRTSGIVALTLPREVTSEHTVMPTGLVWLRATIPKDSLSVCQLILVGNNAVEVRFADQGNDPAHLNCALPAKRIVKLKFPQEAIKSASQPFASYGARPKETDDNLTRRAAERLRHRNRCITAWDYERMLLEAFPAVHKVKCIPHASETSWLAPGNVLLIVVRDLRNQNAIDSLRPRVDTGTLSEMTEFAQRHCGMQVSIRVRNPRYERVKLSFQVRFMPGLSFHFYRRELDEALIRVLTPWAFDTSQTIQFGGQVYRSALLDFVEELPYVDFVSDFKMLAPDSGSPNQDLSSIQADQPDTILVSDNLHIIDEFPDP